MLLASSYPARSQRSAMSPASRTGSGNAGTMSRNQHRLPYRRLDLKSSPRGAARRVTRKADYSSLAAPTRRQRDRAPNICDSSCSVLLPSPRQNR